MKKLLVPAVVAASLSVSMPSRVIAQDAGVVAGVLFGLVVLNGAMRGAQPGTGTSKNTEYAHTGIGVPELSTRQEAFWSKGAAVHTCCFGRADSADEN